MGRPTCPLHDPGNDRSVERRSHRQAARRGHLTTTGQPCRRARNQSRSYTTPWGTIQMNSALYDFFRDQGSIIGGWLALAAGYLVFKGAMRAAEKQVAAVNAQTEAL